MMSAGKNMQSVILFNELFTDLKMPALQNPVLEGLHRYFQKIPGYLVKA